MQKRNRASVTMYSEASKLLEHLTKNKTQFVNQLILQEAKKLIAYMTDQTKKEDTIIALNNLEKAIAHGRLKQQSEARLKIHKRFAKSAETKENPHAI